MMRQCQHHDVRTTLTLDEDVATLLKQAIRRSGEPMKLTVNRALRCGLVQETDPTKPKPFKIRGARHLGLPPAWTSGCVQELLDMLEGPEGK